MRRRICSTDFSGGKKIYNCISPFYEIIERKEMEIKILGPGCPKCKILEKLTREVVEQSGIDATVTKVDDIVAIMNYGVMTTPALVIDGKVVVKGRVPSAEEIRKLLTN